MPWFDRWREKRNLIKEGMSFSIVGPGSDVGIALNYVNPETNGQRTGPSVRIGDLLEAIQMSILLAGVALEMSNSQHQKSEVG